MSFLEIVYFIIPLTISYAAPLFSLQLEACSRNVQV